MSGSGQFGEWVERHKASLSSGELVRPTCRVCGKVGEPRPRWADVPTICAYCAGQEDARRQLERRILDAGIPARFGSSSPDDFRAANYALTLPWIEGETTFAYLHGKTGVGKSHLASVLFRQALVHRAGLWSSIPDVTLRLRRLGEEADALVDRLIASPCLVLDDLGSQRATDHVLEALTCAILIRWDQQRKTLVTGNALPEELTEAHPRLASRVLSGVVLGMRGQDRRTQTTRKEDA